MKCKQLFDCDVGKITFPPAIHGMRPKFEKDLECGQCGKLTIDDVELTELGQTQMTELFFKSEDLMKGGRKFKKNKNKKSLIFMKNLIQYLKRVVSS